jgi:thiamine-monophosphate kinase
MGVRRLDEFARIARFYAPLAAKGGLGLKDDVALIEGARGEHYVLKTDAIVEGVHFRANDPPGDVARKLLRVNLSDLAAKGATPVGYLLVTALPKSRGETWLAAFSRGLKSDQSRYRIKLYGGDSSATRGPVALAVAALGRVGKGKAILRAGARVGDIVYVSGTLGDAALGLLVLQGKVKGLSRQARARLVRRYRLPEPRLALGRRLTGLAHAAADLSDGLVADLGHICAASGVGAVIERARLPLSAAARQATASAPRLRNLALNGGDDYELVFTAPRAAASRIAAAARAAKVRVTAIGRITRGRSVRVLDEAGKPLRLARAGYRHF